MFIYQYLYIYTHTYFSAALIGKPFKTVLVRSGGASLSGRTMRQCSPESEVVPHGAGRKSHQVPGV